MSVLFFYILFQVLPSTMQDISCFNGVCEKSQVAAQPVPLNQDGKMLPNGSSSFQDFVSEISFSFGFSIFSLIFMILSLVFAVFGLIRYRRYVFVLFRLIQIVPQFIRFYEHITRDNVFQDGIRLESVIRFVDHVRAEDSNSDYADSVDTV